MCGVTGVVDKKGIYSRTTTRMAQSTLITLSNRGQELCGLCTIRPDGTFALRKRPGTAEECIPLTYVDQHPTCTACGQTTFSTYGNEVDDDEINEQHYAVDTDQNFRIVDNQPFSAHINGNTEIVVVHNGEINNSADIATYLMQYGIRTRSSKDSEVIPLLIAHFHTNTDLRTSYITHIDQFTQDFVNSIFSAMNMFKGTYSLIVMVGEDLYGVRAPNGNRPLKIFETADHTIISSESAGTHKYGAKFLQSVPVGGISKVSKDVIEHFESPFEICLQKCSFEKPYFMRPESVLTSSGNNDLGYMYVAKYRFKSGEVLFDLHPGYPGIIIPVKDSGKYAGLGYAFRHAIANLGLSFTIDVWPKDKSLRGKMRNFIRGGKAKFEWDPEIKFFNLSSILLDPLLYLHEKLDEIWLTFIDDSLVRGTTMKKHINRVKKDIKKVLFTLGEVGEEIFAKLRYRILLATPRVKGPCPYGINTRKKSELASATMTDAQIILMLEVDEIGFLELPQYMELQGKKDDYCYACHYGTPDKYLIPINEQQLAELNSTPLVPD